MKPFSLPLPASGQGRPARNVDRPPPGPARRPRLPGRREELAQPGRRLLVGAPGLAADPDSPWASLRVGELDALLALRLGDEAAADGFAWVAQFGQLEEGRARAYRALEALLKLPASGRFDAAIAELYGSEALAQARAIISGDDPFFGLGVLGPNFEASARHQALLAAWRKLWP